MKLKKFKRFKKGDVVVVAGTYTKAVRCRCCGRRKYLKYVPYTVKGVVRKALKNREYILEQDGSSWVVLVGEPLYPTSREAVLASRRMAKDATKAEKLRYAREADED